MTFELTRCALNRVENISPASEGEMSSQPREKAVGPMMDSNSASIASHSGRDIVVAVAFCERGLSPLYRSLLYRTPI